MKEIEEEDIMENKKLKLIELLDKAIMIAERKKIEHKNGDDAFKKIIDLTLQNLNNIRENVQKGILAHSKGATLGLAHHIGDWFDDELYDVAVEIDEYFKNEMW
jgi:hypothetical protein